MLHELRGVTLGWAALVVVWPIAMGLAVRSDGPVRFGDPGSGLLLISMVVLVAIVYDLVRRRPSEDRDQPIGSPAVEAFRNHLARLVMWSYVWALTLLVVGAFTGWWLLCFAGALGVVGVIAGAPTRHSIQRAAASARGEDTTGDLLSELLTAPPSGSGNQTSRD